VVPAGGTVVPAGGAVVPAGTEGAKAGSLVSGDDGGFGLGVA